jgi:hypothetical protein
MSEKKIEKLIEKWIESYEVQSRSAKECYTNARTEIQNIIQSDNPNYERAYELFLQIDKSKHQVEVWDTVKQQFQRFLNIIKNS